MAETARKWQEGRAAAHGARAFDHAPDRAAAQALLDAIAADQAIRTAFFTERPIALYGAGNLGRMAREFLKAVWRAVDFVVDRNAETLAGDPAWAGITLYHPDSVPAALKASHVLLVTVATAPYVPLETELSGLGFADVVPFYDFAEGFRHIHPLSNGWFAPPLGASDRAMAGHVLDGFADDLSRAHHLQFLAWRRLRQEWTFGDAPIYGSDRFFIPEVLSAWRNPETFIDGGAHHGSVTLDYDRRTEGRWKAIVAIEPDDANRAVMQQAFATRWPKATRRPEILDCVLGSADGRAAFHAGLGYASQLAVTGNETKPVRSLDSLGLSPGFLKLHLEGGELDALKGGWRTILKHRPVIAATVYHNDDGIWRTPHWLMESLPDYRLLFRLHSWCGTGAVIYAIPTERMRP